eukprot:c970_g1_i1 orf=160-1620(-)
MGAVRTIFQNVKILSFFLLYSIVLARDLPSKHGYQTLLVSEWTAEVTDVPSKMDLSSKPSDLWAVEIVHRDSKSCPLGTRGASQRQVLVERLKRDEARVNALNARAQAVLKGVKNSDLKAEPEGDQLSVEDLSSPVVSGLSQGSGEYFARLGVGTPARQMYLVLDTGSDLSWVQCSPCESCYQQSDPVFNPARSSSFQPVTCSSDLCSELEVRGCQNSQCLYQVSYGDGSFTVGNFVQETISFADGTARGVGIGCGHDNEGLFVGAAGLLGLGSGTLSFPSQIATVSNGQFSYCLADRESGSSSSLIFGNGAVPAGASFTSLLKNPKLGTFYYVPLSGISVGGSRLTIAQSDFLLEASGSGGVILDSGTSVTRLVSSAYTAMRDAFRAGTRNLPSGGSFSLFDTCYNLGGMQSVDVPTVDLHFESGATLSLPASNYLVPVDTVGTYCFAFAPTAGDLSIIGNLQQQGFRISFDSVSSRVGFAGNQC